MKNKTKNDPNYPPVPNSAEAVAKLLWPLWVHCVMVVWFLKYLSWKLCYSIITTYNAVLPILLPKSKNKKIRLSCQEKTNIPYFTENFVIRLNLVKEKIDQNVITINLKFSKGRKYAEGGTTVGVKFNSFFIA